jgi:hypothetical protein
LRSTDAPVSPSAASPAKPGSRLEAELCAQRAAFREHDPPGVSYDLDVPFGDTGQMSVIFSACPTPHGEGDGPGTVTMPGEALLSGDLLTGGPAALLKTSSDNVAFAGSATGSGPEPG